MTLNELKEWMQTADRVAIVDEDYDEKGNYTYGMIFHKEGKLYRIYYMNRRPYEKWGGNHFIRGVYELQEVEERSEVITKYYYEPVKQEKS